MTITAEIIADSISNEGIRLTTMQLRYPRFIHAEFMTHRMFSRNASSSRAIPVKKMIEDLRRDPAMPVFWGSNKPGMQAGDELGSSNVASCMTQWLWSMEQMVQCAEAMMELGLHKQIANRILEPWAHINVVVTATDWKNFFALRRHPDAQPEIKALADAMWNAMQNSQPTNLNYGDWHLPYVTEEDWGGDSWKTPAPRLDYLRMVSVARCARVSYLTHDGKKTSIEEDIALYERLLGSTPLHASPAEHQATPDVCLDIMGTKTWQNLKDWGNFTGWRQLRKLLPNENVPG